MKKLCIILSVICALALGAGVYTYAYVPNTCSSVSGASVTGSILSGPKYRVTLMNRSGSRCSASFTVEGKIDGTWESIGDGILTAPDGSSAYQDFSMRGYDNARVVNISTWKCD
jgi:hypothetical protein